MTRRDVFASLLLGETAALILLGLTSLWGVPALVLLAARLGLVVVPLGALAVVYLGVRFGRRWPLLGTASKFVVVGAVNTLIDLGLLNLLLAAAGVIILPLFAVFKALSFSAAVVHSFLWNRNWSFALPQLRGLRNHKSLGSQFGLFLLATLMGLALDTGVATLLVFLGPPVALLSPLQWANIAAVLALAVSTLWNFCAYRFVVFAPRGSWVKESPGTAADVRLGRGELSAHVAPGLTKS